MASEEDNLYRILGVKSTATQAELQAAYRQKARALHPDVNKTPGAEEQFKRLAAAYAILRDEAQRARYDKYGFKGEPTAPSPGSPPRRGPSRTQRGYSARDFGFDDVRFDDIRSGFEDLKNPFDFFLRRERKKREQAEREVELAISMEHAFRGTTLNLLLEVPDEHGASQSSRVRLKIPRGAKEGDRLKLKDPEITVVLKIEKHPRFILEGRDVSTQLDISPWEAALGAIIEMETPGGPVNVKIPEGTSSGQRLRLRGQGLPLKPGREGEPGDMYVTVKITVPKHLSPKERELFEALKQASSFEPRA